MRTRKLKEGLEVRTGLWRGEPFRYEGEHYRVGETAFLPRPVQEPRLPIRAAGAWPNRAPIRCAARWVDVFPVRCERPLEPGARALVERVPVPPVAIAVRRLKLTDLTGERPPLVELEFTAPT